MRKQILYKIREKLGITQQNLGEALGVTRQWVCAVENGKRPFSNKMQKKLEDYLLKNNIKI